MVCDTLHITHCVHQTTPDRYHWEVWGGGRHHEWCVIHCILHTVYTRLLQTDITGRCGEGDIIMSGV